MQSVTRRKSFVTTITAMWRTYLSQLDWRRQQPRTAALLVVALLVSDGTFIFRDLLDIATVPKPPKVTGATPLRASVDPVRVANAHLFGTDAVAPRPGDVANARETQLDLALSGVIATRNPEQGFAILGPKGQPARLYLVGATLDNAGGGRLYRVFADHVVLDRDGQLETLKLPRHPLAAAVDRPEAAGTAATATEPAAEAAAAEPSAAQNWFASNLFPQSAVVAGRTKGVSLHPDGHMRELYDLHPGDLLTSVNGVEISNLDSLQEALKSSGKTLSMTYVRQGIEHTLSVTPDE
jgi:type II secretion system protein C